MQKRRRFSTLSVLELLWSVLFSLSNLRRAIRKEMLFGQLHNIPWKRRLLFWSRGFLSDKHLLYAVAHPSDLDDFLSDADQLMRSGRVNEPYTAVLNDKLYFWSLFGRLTSRAAPVTALLSGGNFHPLGTDGLSPGPLWRRLAQVEGRFVLKPQYGSAGSGIHLLEAADGLRVDGEACLPSELEARLGPVLDGRSFLLCPFVEQAAYAVKIHPASTNTIRLLTFFDDQTGEVLVGGAVHRFGRSGMNSVADNLQKGGIAAPVDLATGRLGRAVGLPYDGRRLEFATHPDTGQAIEGVVVPRWTQILQEVRDLAARLAFTPYVGWDVIVTADDFVILEGNYRSGVISLQAHRPLLADPRIRDWYRRKGVVRRAPAQAWAR